MGKRTIHTNMAPRAVGPYSQAVVYGDVVYTAGQVAIDPKTNTLVEADIELQTRRVLENLEAVLTESGSSFEDVAKTTIYLVDLKDFQVVNEIYSEFFKGATPARSTVQVAGLPLGALIEMEMIAHLPNSSRSV